MQTRLSRPAGMMFLMIVYEKGSKEMTAKQQYSIYAAGRGKGPVIKRFVLSQMSQLYPKGFYNEDPPDLAKFDEGYASLSNAVFLVAETASGAIAGTAAVRPYDGRFPEVQPKLGEGPVCEIVKFYVHAEHRRSGLGSRLYEAAEQFAREAGYEESYLHTSMFLPGGHPFWLSRGYNEFWRESEDIVHMIKGLWS